jgi:predicted small integral membrane protein
MDSLLIIKVCLLAGLGVWLSIALTNNILDKETNRYLIREMLSMSLISADPNMGRGLLRRACHHPKRAAQLLTGIIIIQCAIVVLLWCAACILLISILWHPISFAIEFANIALLAFLLLWFGFLCGGLWYGYWIKTGHIQLAHFTLFIVSLLSIIIINLPTH